MAHGGPDSEARLGVLALRNLTLLFFYALPDQRDRCGHHPERPAPRADRRARPGRDRAPRDRPQRRQSEVSDHFAGCEGEHGFLIESVGAMPSLHAAGIPWRDGEQHKRDFARMFRRHAPFLSVARDHGEGEVVLDPHGQPLVRWSLTDEVDQRLLVRANVELARLHHAAGAPEIRTLHAEEIVWWRDSGEPFEAFIERIEQAPYGPADITIFTAHQMGSCRMGSDPADSVADGRGQRHDVEGVWIGDASAFPTAPEVNPMVSIMSLARRTAANIARGAGRAS